MRCIELSRWRSSLAMRRHHRDRPEEAGAGADACSGTRVASADRSAPLYFYLVDGAGNRVLLQTQFALDNLDADTRVLRRFYGVLAGLEQKGFRKNDKVTIADWDKKEKYAKCYIYLEDAESGKGKGTGARVWCSESGISEVAVAPSEDAKHVDRVHRALQFLPRQVAGRVSRADRLQADRESCDVESVTGRVVPLTTVEPMRLYRQIAEQIATLIDDGEFRRRRSRCRPSASSPRRSASRARRCARRSSASSSPGASTCASAPASSSARPGRRDRDGRDARRRPGPFDLLAARQIIEGEIAALAARTIKTRGHRDAARDRWRACARATPITAPRDAADREFHVRIAAGHRQRLARAGRRTACGSALAAAVDAHRGALPHAGDARRDARGSCGDRRRARGARSGGRARGDAPAPGARRCASSSASGTNRPGRCSRRRASATRRRTATRRPAQPTKEE